MNDRVVEVLVTLVKQLGPDIAGDPRRLRGYLSDLAGDSPGEIAALLAVAESGGVSELRSWPSGRADRTQSAELQHRLSNLDPTTARWALGTWAAALGIDDVSGTGPGPANPPPSVPRLPHPPQSTPSLPPPAPGDLPSGRHRSFLILATILLVIGGSITAAVVATSHSNAPATAGSVEPPSITTRPATTATTTTTAAAAPDGGPAARQLFALLQQSNNARNEVVNATSGVGSCHEDPQAGIAQLQNAITLRQSVLRGLSGVQTATLAAGSQLQTTLAQALQSSIAADTHYIDWMNDIQSQGCPIATTDPAFQAASTASAQATLAKQAFVASWNPVAVRFGLQQYAPADL